MTQNQNANISAPALEQLKQWTKGASARTPVWLASFLIGASILDGQATNVQTASTATQALISYTAPDTGVCAVEVREGGLQAPLVPDVDPSLFPQSNLDSRAVNLVTGQRRVFVVGKRAVESALDGFRHSRALQNNTSHSFKITCGASVFTGQFTTMNAPLGASYNDPLPADPNQPGQYAWPDFNWLDRNQWVVDPFTGFRIKQFDSPRDAMEGVGSGKFAAASNVGGGSAWANPGAVTADDTSAATYSGTSRGWLFADVNLVFQNFALHNAGTNSPNALVPTFNAWCSSADCSTASADDRTIQFCLTIDQTTCASDILEAPLTACSSNCTAPSYRFPAIVNPTPMLAEWFASKHGIPTIDTTDLSARSGTVNRNGATVSWVDGNRFNLHWGPGATIKINGTIYTISSVDHDAGLTLSGSPAGSDTSASYVASNAGLLVRKKTTSTHQVSIQNISYTFETGPGPVLESEGDEQSYANCSPAEVAGPNGEMGWHCQVAGGIYWVGKDTGTVNRLGQSAPPYNGATDGWGQRPCAGGSYWDAIDGNALYCPTQSWNGHLYVLKFVYTGNNVDIGNLAVGQAVVVCGTAPCWTITNLTPGTSSLDLQMAAFHPDWAASHFHTNSISVFGRMGVTNSLLFMARRDERNDTMAFLFRFDLNTQRIVAAIPTWRYWPLRWAGMHGPGDLNDPSWVLVSSTYFRGPSTGNDSAAGNGPYISNVTSGAIDAVGHPCPARPSNSPIAVSDWPTGNRCLTLTVDGEPADPTPTKYSDGTISATGTTVTGANTNWTSFMDGSQMLIDGAYYTFTYVANNQGTLDRSPGTIANPNYTLYLEPVNNPKVGNPSWGYLQDAEVRDTFCATNGIDCRYWYGYRDPNGVPTGGAETMRLILKNGNSWTLQRGYAGIYPTQLMYPLNANATLIAIPASCYFQADSYPCPDSRVVWDAVNDPYGYNATLTTVRTDPGDKGCCHNTRQNGVNVDVGLDCPTRGGYPGTGCYFARYSGIPETFTDPGFPVSNNPIFHGMVGVGSPNSVDSHPGHHQSRPSADANEMTWIGDARTYLGDVSFGSASAPGTLVGGTLYKFTSSQALRLNPRTLPTMGACGVNPLLDVSGPASSISTGLADNYKYCIALTGGECASGSTKGDIFVNCPQVRFPYCTYQGVGNSDPETRDICLLDMGAHTLNLTQVGVNKPDPDGVNSRRVSTVFSRYHWINPFWNTKILPNGRWMLGWSLFFQGQRNSVLLVKLPPFPGADGINRGDFWPYKVTVPTPQIAGVTNAVVQFGYDKNYFCTSRREACVQANATDFAYQSENPAGVPCTNGCTVSVQALPQRILYYQVLLRDASNSVVGRMDPAAVVIQ